LQRNYSSHAARGVGLAWNFQEGSVPRNHDAGSDAHAHREETMMRFYEQPSDQEPHRFYCGVDLHARCLYLRILDAAGLVPRPEGAKEHSPGRRPGNQRPPSPKP